MYTLREPETASNDSLPMTKRKQSVLIRKVLRTDSASAHSCSVSEGVEPSSSVSVQTVSLELDEELDNKVTSEKDNSEETENDDVFPSIPEDMTTTTAKMKSATVGRHANLAASKSLVNFDHMHDHGASTMGRDNRLQGGGEGRRRGTQSVISPTDGFRRRSRVVSAEKTRDWVNRRGAIKRRSTLDLEYNTCTFRVLADIHEEGQSTSAVITCSSMS